MTTNTVVVSTAPPGAVPWTNEFSGHASENIYLPGELFDRYVSVALRSALPAKIEGGEWYAELADFRGVWATGESPKECLDSLELVLRDWLVLKIADGDRDLPVKDDIDLLALIARR